MRNPLIKSKHVCKISSFQLNCNTHSVMSQPLVILSNSTCQQAVRHCYHCSGSHIQSTVPRNPYYLHVSFEHQCWLCSTTYRIWQTEFHQAFVSNASKSITNTGCSTLDAPSTHLVSRLFSTATQALSSALRWHLASNDTS